MHNLIFFIAAAFIFYRGIHVVTALNRKTWASRACFVGFSASLGAMVGGGIGVAFGFPFAGHLLLLGVGGFFFFDRRQQNLKRTMLAAKL